MNKKRFITFIILLLLLIALYRSNSRSDSLEKHTETHYMRSGIMVNITLYDEYDDSLIESTFDLVDSLESKLSSTIDGSEVNKINESAGSDPVKVSKDTFSLIEKSIYYSQISDGYFDISSGSLIALWDIGGENARVPDQSEIDSIVASIDYKKILLDSEKSTVKLVDPDMKIDLGGISKGYIIDNAAKHLNDNGVSRAIVEAGGDISLIGSPPGSDSWKIGVKDPFNSGKNDYLGIVDIESSSIVTSGVYERKLEEGDKTYHHILNPFTGYPVENNIEGVTVITDNSTDCDALSTSLLLLGLEDGMKLVENLDKVEAIFITSSKDIYLSSNIGSSFELKNDNFTLKSL